MLSSGSLAHLISFNAALRSGRFSTFKFPGRFVHSALGSGSGQGPKTKPQSPTPSPRQRTGGEIHHSDKLSIILGGGSVPSETQRRVKNGAMESNGKALSRDGSHREHENLILLEKHQAKRKHPDSMPGNSSDGFTAHLFTGPTPRLHRKSLASTFNTPTHWGAVGFGM